MKKEKLPYPWQTIKGGTITDIIDRMGDRLDEMEVEHRKALEQDSYENNYSSRIYHKEQKLKKLAFFEPFADKVEVIDDNRLRFNNGIIYPKSFKVKFNGNKTIYQYGQAKMMQFMESLPALNK